MRERPVHWGSLVAVLLCTALALISTAIDAPRPAKQGHPAMTRLVPDFTEDLKKITVPVLVMHGDDDQIVPYADSAPLSARLLRNGALKTYKGFPHGMPTTHAETINADLLAFLRM